MGGPRVGSSPPAAPLGLREPLGQCRWAVHPQRSLEDEINRTTAQDLPIFGVSYIAIFLYISVALGRYCSWRRVPVRIRGAGARRGGLSGHPEASPQGNASWGCPALEQTELSFRTPHKACCGRGAGSRGVQPGG